MNFDTIFSKENLAMSISIVSIIITVWSFISTKNKERIKLFCEVNDIYFYSKSNFISLNITTVNNSSRPITIHRVDLKTVNVKGIFSYRCNGDSEKFITSKVNGILESQVFIQELPIYLPGFGTERGWYKFQLDDNTRKIDLSKYKCSLIYYCNNKKIEHPITIPNESKLKKNFER